LERLIKHKRKLRKLWQIACHPAYKTALNWVGKTTKRMTRRKELERWETKVGNCKATP
jgi:hypothetical protein